MKAVAIIPRKANSIHLREVPKPSVGDIEGGRGVLVKVLQVGVDGTDKEINAGEYGDAPPGEEYLVIGHESFGVVEEVGFAVTEFAPGNYVVATVRRPGNSIYDRIGTYDMTTDDVYYERGINLRHGFLTEYYVDEPDYLVKVPPGLKHVGVLLEPTSVIEKGIAQAYEIQRRMRVWHPTRAAVLGAGTVGLLATLALRLRGLAVCTFGRTKPPYRNSDLLGEIGGCYHSTSDVSITEDSREHGPFDIIFDVEVPADKINLGFVLGNKVVVGTVNANREYFETGVRDMSQAELTWPGWLSKLLTHPVEGLDMYGEMMRLLTEARDAIKVFVRVAEP
jgi:threonine dehydrogenase-like Zn-dependent dehydrogenase